MNQIIYIPNGKTMMPIFLPDSSGSGSAPGWAVAGIGGIAVLTAVLLLVFAVHLFEEAVWDRDIFLGIMSVIIGSIGLFTGVIGIGMIATGLSA